ncbi:MAG: glycosyltransferase [Candidatus Babeliaceae bacterium]
MKKVQIIHLISSLKRGGAETVLATLLAQWNEPIHEHTVIYFHDGLLRAQIEQLGIKTIQLKGLMCLYDPFFLARLFYYFKKLKPTIIYSSLWAANFFGRIAAFFLRIPIICAVHAVAAHEGPLRNRLDYWCPIKPRFYVAVSTQIHANMTDKLAIHADKIRCIPNGIAPQLIERHPNSLTRNHFWGTNHKQVFVIGTVGRLVPVKNYAVLLQAFAQLHTEHTYLRLMIVGNGLEEQNLKNLAGNLAIIHKVHFIGDQAAAEYYPLFDCFIQPSMYEGLSMALLEALYYSLPVIVTGSEGKHEIIEQGKTGIIMSHADAQNIVHAISFLVQQDRNFFRQIREAGHLLVKNSFTSEKMVTRYKQFIEMI